MSNSPASLTASCWIVTYAESATEALGKIPKFKVQRCNADGCRLRLRTGKTDLVAIAGAGPHYEYFYDPTRPESLLARNAVDDALQRAAGRKDWSPCLSHRAPAGLSTRSASALMLRCWMP